MKFSAYNIEIGSSRQNVLLAAATVTVAASAAAFLRTSAFGPKTGTNATTSLRVSPPQRWPSRATLVVLVAA